MVMSTNTLALVSTLVASAGVLFTLGGVIYAGLQVRVANRVAAADFLLRSEAELREHREVHLKLRGGDWTGCGGPSSAEEWAAVEAYLGLFERVGDALIDPGIINLGLAKRSYGYRIDNIVTNPHIRRKKLLGNEEFWEDFIRLQRQLLGTDPRKVEADLADTQRCSD
jgi:hypothetical protein